MKLLLQLLFGAIFAVMIFITVRTSMEMSIIDAFDHFGDHPWAVATLYDAYCGFIIFWTWVAYKEKTWALRIVWLILILGLGNIATSFYVLMQLFRLPPGEPPSAVVYRRTA